VPAVADGLTLIVADVAAVPQLLVTEYEIRVVPAVLPRTTPAAVTLAIAGFTLLQVPPATVLVKVVVLPGQTIVLPEMVPTNGSGFTTNVRVATAAPQMPVTAYEIVLVPVAMAFTTPVLLMDATEGLLLVHVPPVTALDKVTVVAGQANAVPVMVPAPDGVTEIV